MNKSPLRVEWELTSLEQANIEVFGKIIDEMVRISEHLKWLEGMPIRKRKQRSQQRKYLRHIEIEYNHALRNLRYLFEEKSEEAKS